MMSRSRPIIFSAAFALTLAVGGAPCAWAAGGTGPSMPDSLGSSGVGGAGEREPPAPSAVPGTHAGNAPVADPEKPISEMTPNEALFDAINRGDVAFAQDAIRRGADLSARNVLGMSPLELSIDLDRDKITFLLLALRDTDPGARPPPPARVMKASARQPAPAARPVPKPVVKPLPPADPGTPDPQAGFLGFSGR